MIIPIITYFLILITQPLTDNRMSYAQGGLLTFTCFDCETCEIKTGLHSSSAHGPTIFTPNMLHSLNPVRKLPTVKIPPSCMSLCIMLAIVWLLSTEKRPKSREPSRYCNTHWRQHFLSSNAIALIEKFLKLPWQPMTRFLIVTLHTILLHSYTPCAAV